MTRAANPVPAEGERPYLTEASLGRFLRERLDEHIIANMAVPSLTQRYRPDYRSEPHKLIVEFDGDQHYQRASHVIGDGVRDKAFIDAGYKVVRIPYFVQLTEPVIGLLFGTTVENRAPFKDFQHGFIDERVIFPADFCEIGIERFQQDL